MKTPFVTISMLMATLATATVFADDAQNAQMGQNQPAAASTQSSSAPQQPVDSSATGSADTTTTTTTTPAQAAPQSN